MPKTDNVIFVRFPKTTAQASRLKGLAKRKDFLKIEITVLQNEDEFRLQRTWRILFGLYQDCTSVRQSKGFKKIPGLPFIGKIRPSKLVLFLQDAMPLVIAGLAEVRVEGDRLRPRLLDVMMA